MKPVLYQFNVALMRAPYTDPLWDEWKRLVPIVHQQAECAQGFVANYDGTVTELGYLAPYPRDPLVMGNLSAWTSEDALKAFTFSGTHGKMMKHRTKWFAPWRRGVHYIALWWDLPGKFNLEQAKRKLAMLQAHGPIDGTVHAWTPAA